MSDSELTDDVRIASSDSDTFIPLEKKYFGLSLTRIKARKCSVSECSLSSVNSLYVHNHQKSQFLSLDHMVDAPQNDTQYPVSTTSKQKSRILNEIDRHQGIQRNSSLSMGPKKLSNKSWVNDLRQHGRNLRLGNITVQSAVSQPPSAVGSEYDSSSQQTEDEGSTLYHGGQGVASSGEETEEVLMQDSENEENRPGFSYKRSRESCSSDTDTSVIFFEDLSDDDGKNKTNEKPVKKKQRRRSLKAHDLTSRKCDDITSKKGKKVPSKGCKRRILTDSSSDTTDNISSRRSGGKKSKCSSDGQQKVIPEKRSKHAADVQQSVISETSSSGSGSEADDNHASIRKRQNSGKSKTFESSHRFNTLGKKTGDNIFSQVINQSSDTSSEDSDATVIDLKDDNSLTARTSKTAMTVPVISLKIPTEEEGVLKNVSESVEEEEEEEDSQPLLQPISPVKPVTDLIDEELPSLSLSSRSKNKRLSLNKNGRQDRVTVVSTPPSVSKVRVDTGTSSVRDDSTESKATKSCLMEEGDSSSDTDLDTPLRTLAERRRNDSDSSSVCTPDKPKVTNFSEAHNSKEERMNSTDEQIEPSVENDSPVDPKTLPLLKTDNSKRSSNSELSEVVPYQGGTSKTSSVPHSEYKEKQHVSTVAATGGVMTDSEIGREIKQEVEEVRAKLANDFYTQEDDTILIDSDSDDNDLLESFSQETVGLRLGAGEDPGSEEMDATQELQELLELSDTEVDEIIPEEEMKHEPSPSREGVEEDCGDMYQDTELYYSDESLFSPEEDDDDDVVYGYDVATQVSPDFVRANGGDEFYLDSPELDPQEGVNDDELYGFQLDKETGDSPYQAATQACTRSPEVDPYNAQTQVDHTDPYMAQTQAISDGSTKKEDVYLMATQAISFGSTKQEDVYHMATQKDVKIESPQRISAEHETEDETELIDLTDAASVSSGSKDDIESIAESSSSHGEGLSSSSRDGATETYACPVCNKDIRCKGIFEMNIHIDECLSTSYLKELEEEEKDTGESGVQDLEKKTAASDKDSDVDDYTRATQIDSHRLSPSTGEDDAFAMETQMDLTSTRAIEKEEEDFYTAQTQVDSKYKDLSDDSTDEDDDVSHYTAQTQLDPTVQLSSGLDPYSVQTLADTGLTLDSEDDNDLYLAATQVDHSGPASPLQDDYTTPTLADLSPGSSEAGENDDIYTAQTQVDAVIEREDDEDQDMYNMDTQIDDLNLQIEPKLTKKNDVENRTPNRPEINQQRSKLISIKQLSVNNRKPVLISPQKQKSLADKREEFRKQKEREKAEAEERDKANSLKMDKLKFYSSTEISADRTATECSGLREKLSEKRNLNQDGSGWMSKSVGSLGGPNKRKQRVSREKSDSRADLDKALIQAKSMMNDRRFHTALHPKPVVRKSSSATVTSPEQITDVRLPNQDEIRKMGLPVLEYGDDKRDKDESMSLIQETTSAQQCSIQTEKPVICDNSHSEVTMGENKTVFSTDMRSTTDAIREKQVNSYRLSGVRLSDGKSNASLGNEKRAEASNNKRVTDEKEVTRMEGRKKEKDGGSESSKSSSASASSKKLSRSDKDLKDRHSEKDKSKDHSTGKQHSSSSRHHHSSSRSHHSSDKSSRSSHHNIKSSTSSYNKSNKDGHRSRSSSSDKKDGASRSSGHTERSRSSSRSSQSSEKSSKSSKSDKPKSVSVDILGSSKSDNDSNDKQRDKCDEGDVPTLEKSSQKNPDVDKAKASSEAQIRVPDRELKDLIDDRENKSGEDVQDNRSTIANGELSEARATSSAYCVDEEKFSSKLQHAKVDKMLLSQEKENDSEREAVEIIQMETEVTEKSKTYRDKYLIKKKSTITVKSILIDPSKPRMRKKRRVSFRSPERPVCQGRTQRFLNTLTERGPPAPQRTSSIYIPNPASGNIPPAKPGPSNDARQKPNLMEKIPLGNRSGPGNALAQPLVGQTQGQPFQHLTSVHQPQHVISSMGSAYSVPQPSTSAHDTRMTLAQQSADMDVFLSRLLKWNVKWFEEQGSLRSGVDIASNQHKSQVKELPPINDGDCQLFHIPSMFSSYEDYVNIFTPHLMAETWEIATKAYSANKAKPRAKYKALYSGLAKTSEKLRQLKFHGILTKRQSEEMRGMDLMSDGGLVIVHLWGRQISNSPDVQLTAEQQRPVHSLQLCMMERVNFYTRDTDRVETLKTFPILKRESSTRSSDFVVAMFVMKGRARHFQPMQDQFSYIEPVVSLVSIMRQYIAMKSLPRSPLCSHILNPSDMSVFIDPPGQRSQNLQLVAKYNGSQRQAVYTAGTLAASPPSLPMIRLLQGPPGTGKSHTVIGMIDRILKVTERKGCVCMCAPSNAAIDVITRRLLDYKRCMLRKTEESIYNIRIVRIGNQSTMHPEVKSIGLTELVQRNIKDESIKKQMHTIPQSVRDDFDIRKDRIRILNEQYQALGKDKTMQARKVFADMKREERQLEEMEKQHFKPPCSTFALEYDMKRRVLLNADVICGTLNSFGQEFIKDILMGGIRTQQFRFTCAIIDEACQANEVDCLIPLTYGITKLILVGDPEQLPPTVLSQKASERRFGQSLFERMYDIFKVNSCKDRVNPTLMLNIQYRMDPEIASFPSRYIYDEKLLTDSSISQRNNPLRPYLLYNVVDSQEMMSQVSGSISNVTEAEFIVELTAFILEKKCVGPHDIGIIAPYRKQKQLLQDELKKHKLKEMNGVEVGTVDGFQGREKAVIIMSCVRAKSETGGIGFMGSRRRMNVALTRAKIALYIVGHLDSLKDGNREWRELINDAEERKLIVKVQTPQHFKNAIQMCQSPRRKSQ